jgi:hypothetical protein
VKVGTLVKLKCECLGNPPGTVGVCYEEYDLGGDHGSSFIFENGNYDGFSIEDQRLFLERIGHYPLTYVFTNVMKLSEDYNNKVFEGALHIFGREGDKPCGS